MGNPWYRADVGIREGRIAEIGFLHARQAVRTIDVKGQVIAPGFIDMMGGSSFPLLEKPASGQSKLRQGITTMFAGEGTSEAPRGDDAATGGFRWRTFAEYFTILEDKGIPLNVVHNVGAAQVRRLVIGVEDRAPTAAELDRMRQLVDEAMRDGAAGLSTALIYPPGTYARHARTGGDGRSGFPLRWYLLNAHAERERQAAGGDYRIDGDWRNKPASRSIFIT